MNKFLSRIKGFFLPPQDTPLWLRLAPYLALGILSVFVLSGGAYAWEYTNSPEFCGQTCHTMPPEYTSYLVSPHARVDCVDCHIGQGFITERITRKAGDVKHVIASVFKTYEYPIKIKQMRPARETCELCHFPEKFSDDSLRENNHYRSDLENSSYTVHLILKTGGGSQRVGLGQGIHWHIENPVLYLPLDKEEQKIPYVRVVAEDGSSMEYIDINSELKPDQIIDEDLKEMDCITCHNRITHLVSYPEDIIDQLMERGLISTAIPEIREVALETYYKEYSSMQTALASFDLLDYYYQEKYPDFYTQNSSKITQAIDELQTSYSFTVFLGQKSDWTSHPDNIGHENSPGCFRCHDGQHLNPDNEAIRLECNLCHAIPVVSEAGDFLTVIELSTGPEPESHLNTNWISLHHLVFEPSCGNCHTMADPGGTSNASFCSNSACHGVTWEFAGFDAPALRETILEQLPTPQPTPSPAIVPEDPENLTYSGIIRRVLLNHCGACHGESGQAGLDLSDYKNLITGSENGPVIYPGNPGASLLLQKTSGPEAHFAQFTNQELKLIQGWISGGAIE
ncbi:MAG: NapC/NirT family cytochrome c [Anaerolineales bacterium]